MLQISNLAFGFSTSTDVFNDNVDSSKIIFLVGANGSGKTSLLKSIAGLLPARSGSIQINGQALDKLKVQERPLYLSAYPEVTDWLTGHDVFEIFCSEKNHWQLQVDLEDLDILGKLNAPIHQLSLGEQKKIFLAAALRSHSEVLLLDEPLNSLDWNMEPSLGRIIERHRKLGRSFLIAAHQLQWMARFEDCEIWFIHGFSRIKAGPIEKTLSSPEVQEIFNFAVCFTDNPLDGSRLIATSEEPRRK